MKYQRYKRGQIILVDFSPSLGSEMRGKHFAIVMTKNDSPNNGVLTVIPLSSKAKDYYLDVGNIVEKQIYPELDKIMVNFHALLDIIDEMQESEIKANIEGIKKVLSNAKDFIEVCNLYLSKNKRSYALVQNITTISKIRIKKAVNQYDPMKRLIADSLILDLIENKMKELYFN